MIVNNLNDVFIHNSADVQAKSIGPGTTIWQFSVVLAGAKIGRNVNLNAHTFVENDVRIGDNVTIKSGVFLWDGIEIEDDVFIGPNSTFTNDKYPRSKKHLQSPMKTLVRRGASVGANATVLPGVTIGQFALVGAGAIVTSDVPDFAVVVGSPARIVSYVNQKATGEADHLHTSELVFREDPRGKLIAAEVFNQIPFRVQRFFTVFEVPSQQIRGQHAHLECHQFLVCLQGSVTVELDDGHKSKTVLLDSPTNGLYIPPLTWGTQYNHSKDSILLVLASHNYEEHDYVRDYQEFKRLIMGGKK